MLSCVPKVTVHITVKWYSQYLVNGHYQQIDIYRSNPISAHHILILLLSQTSTDSCTFNNTLFSSLPPPLSFYFALLCFLCCCFVFVIFILNFSELAKAHITDVQRTYRCVRRLCLCRHTHEYMHNVLRRIGPHSVHGCILNWISILAPVCTTQT